MEEKIKELVKKLFDAGMTLDEAIKKIVNVAETEDFKRFKNEEC